MLHSVSNCLPPDVKHRTSRRAHFIAQALQLQVTGTGRTIMVDAPPTMTAARLARVTAAQTGVPQGSFALYYGSRPMRGTLKEIGVASGSTIELKFRGRGGGPEQSAINSLEVLDLKFLYLSALTTNKSSEIRATCSAQNPTVSCAQTHPLSRTHPLYKPITPSEPSCLLLTSVRCKRCHADKRHTARPLAERLAGLEPLCASSIWTHN